jgi:hypothetical protein
MQRLKDATRNLLGAAKDALTDPTPESGTPPPYSSTAATAAAA